MGKDKPKGLKKNRTRRMEILTSRDLNLLWPYAGPALAGAALDRSCFLINFT
jgi:hypothetical protein